MFPPRVSGSISINASIDAWKDYIDSCQYHSHQVSATMLALIFENGFQTDFKASTLVLMLIPADTEARS